MITTAVYDAAAGDSFDAAETIRQLAQRVLELEADVSELRQSVQTQYLASRPSSAPAVPKRPRTGFEDKKG